MKLSIPLIIIFFLIIPLGFSKPIIVNHGVNQTKINIVLNSINQSYINDLQSIEFVYSNPKYRTMDGFYTPYNIVLYDYNYPVSRLSTNLKHEAKHHYCMKQDGGYVSVDAMKHIGCFLNTPIDKEYGFIK